MSLSERLFKFVREEMEENDIEMDGQFDENTSLLKSGLFDSLTLLDLTAWIEEELGVEIDLMAIDPVTQWDTISDILNFISLRKKTAV